MNTLLWQTPPMKRRNFLKSSLVGGLTFPAIVKSQDQHAGMKVAGVGVGGMGKSNLTNLVGADVVALCDVDHQHAQSVFDAYPGARRYFDIAEMLDQQPEIEGVVIATPDHTHASLVKAALEAGKHVYCQKPLTHDIAEARYLAGLAAKFPDAVAVMGNQFHSSAGMAQIHDWIGAGLIGEVSRVVAWCDLTYRPFGHARWSTLLDRPAKESRPIPASLDWSLWMGPREMRPYHPTYHPGRWRAWWDFGCGMMGDRGVHTLDAACYILDLTAPDTIELKSIEGENEYVHPDKAHIVYRFPERNGKPPLTLDWYSGSKPAEVNELTKGGPAGDDQGGALFIGSRGMISHGTYPARIRLHPGDLKQDAAEISAVHPRFKDSHETVWVKACQGRGPSASDFAYAAKLTELTHLGNLAINLGGKIKWDAVHARVTNRPEAADLIARPRRKGWTLD
ncbi:MAG: Gfo/Idh/MocA family oxidoreductase [Synoicihabitans sp.]